MSSIPTSTHSHSPARHLPRRRVADGKDSVSPRVSDLTPGSASFTVASGSSSKLLGRATFGDPGSETFKIKRITGDWHIEVKAKSMFDLAVQTIDFPKGSHSGWHSHPGPVFIQVASGTMTFYESERPDVHADRSNGRARIPRRGRPRPHRPQ